jgi:hypothetical protein
MEEEEEEAKNNPKLDVLDLISVKAKQGIGITVDLEALAGIEKKIDAADASGDGNVDIGELQSLMGDIDLSTAFPGKVSTSRSSIVMLCTSRSSIVMLCWLVVLVVFPKCFEHGIHRVFADIHACTVTKRNHGDV